MAGVARVISCLPRRKSVSDGAANASHKVTVDVFAEENNVPHVASQMEFARVFLKVAQKEYDSGCVMAGRQAEARAAAALAEAKRSLGELGIPNRSLLLANLDTLDLAFTNLISSTNHDSAATGCAATDIST
ncbi:MAG TPA: hypothetical protein VGL97_05680 [Bryobacteraceae bacterium]|jgi:hypothetical protein